MLLLIDNFDSFVHNLARLFERLGQRTLVMRNDVICAETIRQMGPQAIVLSPGPSTPERAGNSLEIVRQLHTEFPFLGVCLGHQTIAAALGGSVVRAAEPMHGRTSDIWHGGERMFSGLKSPMTVCRYHSLVVDPERLPEELAVTAWTKDGTVMALEHTCLPLVGFQFHPEAILTEGGYLLLANFLSLVGCPHAPNVAELAASENRTPKRQHPELPAKPVTF
jgi:anthranilate synthase/aminodeoxychorismate synthase-like glutamine amidotransferase